MNRNHLLGASMLAVAMAAGPPAALAAEPSAPQGAAPSLIEEVVVTGSLIRGTPKDAATPVDVVTAEAMVRQGSPSVVQFIKTLTAAPSGIGESNRFTGGSGTASINLRGLGAARTLVLFNGRRLADTTGNNPQGGGADVNLIPLPAIGRIEVLKDGAAATYGSDAIAGVVNFITRRDLDGLEVDADYAAISGSDGDYRANLAWGWQGDAGNILVTAGYRHRSALDIRDTDWGIAPFQSVNYGGWSGSSNPGNYILNTPNGPATTLFRDNGCNELGGQLTVTSAVAANGIVPISTPTAGATCRFQFSSYNDVVNEENHYQVYGELNLQVTDAIDFHGEVGWSQGDSPNIRVSPSNLNNLFPTGITPTCMNPPVCTTFSPGGGSSGSLATPAGSTFFVRYNVPGANPGLRDLTGQAPGSTCAISPLFSTACAAIIANGDRGVDISQTAFRAVAHAGNPRHDGAGQVSVLINSFRLEGGFEGRFGETGRWSAHMGYQAVKSTQGFEDLVVNKVQAALNGYGSREGASDQCTLAERTPANAGNAAAGCYFFNPFTNSVAVSATNGQANPFYRGAANPSVVNDPAVVAAMYGVYDTVDRRSLGFAELQASGDMPITLPGGTVKWGAGAQYRLNRGSVTYGDLFNIQKTPCVDSVDDGAPLCALPTGPIVFYGSGKDIQFDRTAMAVFGELSVPLLETLELNGAARYERFSDGIGDSFNPRIAVKWQALPWLALRGSASTTFRAPQSNFVTPQCDSRTANLGGNFRTERACGNPALSPEKANNYNAGVIVERGGLLATLDYYRVDFKDEITTESASALARAMFPSATGRCGDPAFAALQARFTFAGACNAANLLSVTTYTVNGAATKVDGLDLRVSYDWTGAWDTDFQVGLDGTYLLHATRGAFGLLEAPNLIFAPSEERAGRIDLLGAYYSFPRTRANLWLNASRGPLNARWQIRYSEGVRPGVGTPNDSLVQTPVDAQHPEGYGQAVIGKSKDFWQHDLTVIYSGFWDTRLSLSIQNVFDRDPPFVPSNLNYDYTNGNPLGRVVQVGVKKAF